MVPHVDDAPPGYGAVQKDPRVPGTLSRTARNRREAPFVDPAPEGAELLLGIGDLDCVVDAFLQLSWPTTTMTGAPSVPIPSTDDVPSFRMRASVEDQAHLSARPQAAGSLVRVD